MKTSLYVISDLHLGGEPPTADSPGFQICPPATQALLAAFIERLPAATAEQDCRLVIAGDIVDFLAEESFAAFTVDARAARAKLQAILQRTAPVWAALRAFVGPRKGALTLMLGNHDVELSLPGVREDLEQAIGPGRVEFLCDNLAFTFGPVLIEHGNRFDAWNAVPHGALRRVRSQLSRRRAVQPGFPALPGSRLVVDVMNGLKKQYAFIDLLKPENACALPIAAALGAGSGTEIWKAYKLFRQQQQRDYDEEGEPLDPELISAGDGDDQLMYDLAQNVAAGGDAQTISAAGDRLRGIAGAVAGQVAEQVRAARRAALFQAFRGVLSRPQSTTFALGHETKEYLIPAQRAARKCFQVVVYGHTHLVKRVPLVPGQALPVYLNTGTWADLMRLPGQVRSWDEQAARAVLQGFVDDLENNRLARWRRSVPTYARIELDGDTLVAADVHFGDNDEAVTDEALTQRLQGGETHA